MICRKNILEIDIEVVYTTYKRFSQLTNAGTQTQKNSFRVIRQREQLAEQRECVIGK